jgi:hypothetical protein
MRIKGHHGPSTYLARPFAAPPPHLMARASLVALPHPPQSKRRAQRAPIESIGCYPGAASTRPQHVGRIMIRRYDSQDGGLRLRLQPALRAEAAYFALRPSGRFRASSAASWIRAGKSWPIRLTERPSAWKPSARYTPKDVSVRLKSHPGISGNVGSLVPMRRTIRPSKGKSTSNGAASETAAVHPRWLLL